MMNRRGWVVVALAAVAWLLIASQAMASNFPCPAKGQSCARIRAAVLMFGVGPVIAHAKACGWTDREIDNLIRGVIGKRLTYETTQKRS